MAFASTPFHGKLTAVEKNGTKVDYEVSWGFNASVDMSDVSRKGQQWKEQIPGQGSWNGTMTFHFVPGNTEQKALMDNIIAATPGTKLTDVKLLQDADTNAFTGDIYLTTFGVTAAVGDKVDCTFNFVGNGAPALTDGA